MRLYGFTLIILLLIFSSVPVLSQDTLNLSDAIQIGLEQNFNIRIAQNNQQVAENNYSLGNAGFLPTLGVNASYLQEIQDTRQVFAGDTPPQVRDNAKSSNLAAEAFVNWVIFDGTQMFVNYQQLQELKNVETANTEATIENTIADISSAFYAVILAKAQLDVFQETLDVSKERLDIAQAKYRVGKASKLEFLTAQVDFNADRSALIQQQQVLYNAKVDLNNLLNRSPENDFNVPGSIDPNLNLNKGALQNQLISNNPNLVAAQNSQNVAYLEMKRLRTQYLPVISLNGGYSYNSLEAQAGFVLFRESSGTYYGATASWNIFDGFNRRRNIQNARIGIETSQLEVESTRQSLLAELERNFASYKNSIQLLELEQANLDVAKENTQIALQRYRLGNTNNLELREVQQDAVEAESRLINAIYDIKIAEIELLRLSGQIVSGDS